MAGTSRDISCVMTSAANNYNTRLDSSVRLKTRIRIRIPELCALARILFYVTSVRIRVFMRTLESKLVL